MLPRPQDERGLAPGAILAGYRLEAQLGEGAMGYVFRATRLADELAVALKVVKDELASDETHRRRFLHEARAAAAIEHPNLVGVIEAGEADGRQYIAMRYVAGTTLEQRVQERVLGVDETVQLAAEIGGALDALHTAGLVHRDVKASNILLDRDGTAALSDFGLARGEGYSALTTPGRMLGTLDYLAPERIKGERGTPAGDVYALGCVLVEALTGQPPFAGKGMMGVAFAHLEEPPRNPAEARDDVPAALGQAVLMALAKLPQERPSARDYVHALQAAAAR